jgi:hypothetical protein
MKTQVIAAKLGRVKAGETKTAALVTPLVVM